MWGKLRRKFGEWSVSARIDTDSYNLGQLDLDLQARGGPTDLSLTAQGSLDTFRRTGELWELGLRQTFDAPGGDLSVFPRFNLVKRKVDVRVEYQHEKTRLQIDADMDAQRIILAQRLGDNNSISHSISSNGDMELVYRRAIGDKVMTASYTPSKSTAIKYEDGPWVASADIPMEGYYNFNGGGAKLHICRTVYLDAT